MGLIKVLVTVLLLPVLIGVTQAFLAEATQLHQGAYHLFLSGILAYAICHLFVVNWKVFYEFYQKAFSESLRFSPFLSNYVPLILPLLPMLVLLGMYVTVALTKDVKVEPYFVFFIGFTLAMHIILTAQHLYAEDSTALKTHYFLVMVIAFILNLVFVSLMLDLNFASFSSLSFFEKSWEHLRDIYSFFYNRFCVPRS
jgi:hypothetical protein